jgi:hypothetical protein
MPNFNKSKGFQLRSGNGPLAFKNMGSSPVHKQGEDMVKIDPIQTKEIKQTKLSPPDKLEKAKNIPSNKKEAVTLQDKKDNLKSVKKDNRSDKKELRKEHRAEKKAYKEANKGTEGYKENKKTMKAVQKDERKALRTNRKADKKEARDAVKSDPEYIAKKDADRKKASEIMIGISKNFDPNSQFKSLAEQEAQSSTTKRRNQNIEDYETGKNKELELDNEPSNKTNTDGTAKITTSTAQKVDEENTAKKTE